MTSLTRHADVDSLARGSYRAAILDEADRVCRGEPTNDADAPLSLHLRGQLALENLQPELGLICLARAAELARGNDSYAEALQNALEPRPPAFHDAQPLPDGNAREASNASSDRTPPGDPRVILAHDPYNLEACHLLVDALCSTTDNTETAATLCQFGESLRQRHRHAEAAAIYRHALAIKLDYLPALLGLGWTHVYAENATQAITCFEAALRIEPGDRLSHFGLQWACGLAEDYARAWREVAWFERHVPKNPRLFEQPQWSVADLAGRTILLWADAGLGDVLQRLRYLPLVKARHGRTIVECDRKLITLVESIPGVDRVVARDTPLPSFDVQAPLSLLPGIFFQLGAESIPAHIPYLSVEPSMVEHWRRRLAPEQTPLVGLAWACRPLGAFKSFPLQTYAPLAAVEGVRFINLQLGPQAGELLAPPAGMRIEQHLDESCSVAETAALMLNLDLVISVETMIPHLAGALGVPVWMVTAYGADWRWLLWTERSPWYPTMRLFRQQRSGQWSEAVERVADALKSSLS